MSTETTNKKIKIDNGTTFGRTYTDKAVDELLKNVGGGGISVIELTDKNGTIASAQLGKINANPQNFAFKYNGKILLFTSAGSTTYQYCNNTTNSSDNNVMTTSTLLTIESSTGVYTIAENAHNVAANSIHPVNGGDLTNIQVGSKVYSIPSGGGQVFFNLFMYYDEANDKITQEGWDKLSNGLINGTYCGILYDELPLVVIGFNGARTLYAFETTEEKDNASIKITVKSDLTYIIENIPVLNLPSLPTDASTKNYALNSVNGTLTWNTIGDGLTIENGALKAKGLTLVAQFKEIKDGLIILNNKLEYNKLYHITLVLLDNIHFNFDVYLTDSVNQSAACPFQSLKELTGLDSVLFFSIYDFSGDATAYNSAWIHLSVLDYQGNEHADAFLNAGYITQANVYEF